MKVLMWFIIMLVMVSLQSTVIPVLAIEGVRPDLVLVAVVSAALSGGRETGVLCGTFGGILQDLLSGGAFGVNTLSKMLVGLLVGVYERKINKKNLLMPLLAVSAGTIATLLIQSVFLLGYGQSEAMRMMLAQFPPVLAYHLLMMVPVHMAFLWLRRRQDRV